MRKIISAKKAVLLLVISCMSFAAPVFAETDASDADITSGNENILSEHCVKAVEGMVSGILFKDIYKSFAEPKLTDERKAKLYEQYKIKLFEIAMDHDMNFELLPMEEFEERDWVTPEKFKEHLKYMASLRFEVDKSEQAAESYTFETPYKRTAEKDIRLISADGKSAAIIKIKGEPETDFDERARRQVFVEFDSVTSFMESGIGSWEHLGYERYYSDGFRTCMVIIGGTYKSGGASMQLTGNVYFYCRPTGQIV